MEASKPQITGIQRSNLPTEITVSDQVGQNQSLPFAVTDKGVVCQMRQSIKYQLIILRTQGNCLTVRLMVR